MQSARILFCGARCHPVPVHGSLRFTGTRQDDAEATDINDARSHAGIGALQKSSPYCSLAGGAQATE